MTRKTHQSKTRLRPLFFGIVLLLVPLIHGCKTPKEIDPHVQKGYELLGTDPRGALEQLERAKEKDDLKVLYAKGLAFEALGELGNALQQFDALLKKKPDHVRARTARARLLLLSGERQKGHELLADVVKDAPHALPSLLLFAVSAKSEEERKSAARALSAWTGRADGDEKALPPAEYLLTRSELARETGNVSLAQDLIAQGKKAPVESQAAAIALAKLAQAFGKPRLAQTLLVRLGNTELSPALAREVVNLSVNIGALGSAELAHKQIPVYPEDPDNFLSLGRYHVAASHHASAIDTLTRAVKDFQKERGAERAEAQFLLGQALLQKGRAQDALVTWGALPKKDQERLSTQLLMSQAELQVGKKEQAILRLEDLQERHPDSRQVRGRLASALIDENRLEDATKVLQAALVQDPNDEESVLLMVDLLLKQKKFDEARTRLDEALLKAPSSVPFAAKLVDALLLQKKSDEAISLLKQRLSKSPQDERSALLLAGVYESLNRRDELRKTLMDLTAQVPKSVGGWLSLSRVEEAEGNRKAVEAALLKVLELDSSHRETLHHLAAHYTRAGEAKKAAEKYERLLELRPEDAISMNNLALLYVERLSDPNHGVVLAEKASQLSPLVPLKDTLGWALLVRGRASDRERALSLLKRAASGLKDPDSRLHLAVAHALVGHDAESKKLLEGFSFKQEVPGHVIAQRLLTEADQERSE